MHLALRPLQGWCPSVPPQRVLILRPIPQPAQRCHQGLGLEALVTPSILSCRPLVYTVSLLLPAAYLIGLFFTLKTHSHIYDIHISDCHSECPQTTGYPFLGPVLSMCLILVSALPQCLATTTVLWSTGPAGGHWSFSCSPLSVCQPVLTWQRSTSAPSSPTLPSHR